MREIDRMKQDLVRSEAALAEHRDRELNLRNTLLTAQRLADQIRENAEQEAKVIIREAESRADLVAREGTGPAAGDRARDRRAEAAAPGRRVHPRGVDLGADQRARLRPRQGRGHQGREGPAPPAARTASPSCRWSPRCCPPRKPDSVMASGDSPESPAVPVRPARRLRGPRARHPALRAHRARRGTRWRAGRAALRAAPSMAKPTTRWSPSSPRQLDRPSP